MNCLHSQKDYTQYNSIFENYIEYFWHSLEMEDWAYLEFIIKSGKQLQRKTLTFHLERTIKISGKENIMY